MKKKTSLLLGPPGTGKTTKLNGLVTQWLERTNLDRIAYVSFTKAAIQEIVSRCLEQQSGSIRNDFVWFRTLHSAAYRVTGAGQSTMMDKDLIEKFEHLMEGKGYDVEMGLQGEDSAANKRNIPMYIHHLATNRFQDPYDSWMAGDFEIPYVEVEYVIRSYEAFKKHHGVYDFNDLLTNALGTNLSIDVDIVFLDEAQDLTPLQWKVFWNLFKNAKVIYIAGDDDQAIYEWSGVVVKDFLEVESVRKKVLDKSYRLPENIKLFAEDIIKPITARFEKEFEPLEKGGVVKKIFWIDPEKLLKSIRENETWLFLVRNICFSDSMKEILNDIGIPYLCMGWSSLRADEVKAIITWENFRTGKLDQLNTSHTDLLSKYMSTNRMNVFKSWFENFNKMNASRMEYYRRVLANGFKLTGDLTVELTTIHRVKGRESDNVVIIPDMTRSTFKLLETNSDQEHRVFYVAATRAKQRLFLLEPFTNMYYDFGGYL